MWKSKKTIEIFKVILISSSMFSQIREISLIVIDNSRKLRIETFYWPARAIRALEPSKSLRFRNTPLNSSKWPLSAQKHH